MTAPRAVLAAIGCIAATVALYFIWCAAMIALGAGLPMGVAS